LQLRKLHGEEFVLFTKCYEHDKINEKEMGLACSTQCGDKKCLQNFGFEITRKTSDSWEAVVKTVP
jgi:translation initiation factor 2 beta subunit (eIF-2beta)/eIF-5